MFGQQPQSTSGSTPGTQNLFGSTTAPSGGFSFGGGSTTGAAAGGAFSFGQQGSAAAPKSGGFSFGAMPTPSQAQPQSQTQTQAPPTFSFNAAAPKPAGGFSFGPTATAPTQSATPGLSSGGTAGASGGFKFGDVGKQPTATTGAGGFAFPMPSAGPAATQAAGPTAGGFNLGQPNLSSAGAAPQPQASSSATSTSAGAGFSLGGAAGGFKLPSATAGATGSTAATVQPTQAATSTAAAGGLGGGLGGGMKLGGFSLPTSTAQSTISTSAPTGLKLGMTATSAPGGLALGAATTATPSMGGGLKLGGLLTTTPASSAATSATTGLGLLGAKPTTTTAPGPGLGGGVAVATATMSYRELEEGINKWTVELEEQEKVFLHQAAQVNAWDRMLVNNGEKITSLHTDLETVKADQQRLEHELDYIVAQQRELEDILVPLEDACKTQEGSLYRQHTDVERERTYQMSENIDSQLKRMVQDLKEIIDHMNTSSTPADQADPIGQVAKILNAHMNSLQWIDQNTGLLQRKVDEVTRQYEIVKRDQERNVHLAFE